MLSSSYDNRRTSSPAQELSRIPHEHSAPSSNMEGVANASLPPVKRSQMQDTWYLKGEMEAALTKQRKHRSALSSKVGQSEPIFLCLCFQAVESSPCQT